LKLVDLAKRAFGLSSHSASSLFLLQEPASSGERVTEETAWQLVPVYRAITMIANDLGRLPLTVSSMTAAGSSAIMSSAAAQIVRSGRGELLELVPLLPAHVSMHVKQNTVTYRHSELGELQADEVLHLRAPGADGLWGESPIRLAREALGLQRAMDRTAGALYRNAGVPKLAFVHPGALSGAAQQSIVDSYMAKHAGADNAGRPLVLGEGMRVERINQTLEDQMFAASRDFGVQEVSRLFGVPVVYLSEHSRSTFASITELTRSYWDGCLAHWCAAWADEVRRKMLAPGQKLVWDTRDLLKGSFSDQVSALRSAVEVGLLTQNEARERLGLNPVAGGDQVLRPANTYSDQDEDGDDEDDADVEELDA
jgi:HK97 family phage portal protein